MKKEELLTFDISEDEIREQFRLLTGRTISPRTVSVGKCIGKAAQRRIIQTLKPGLMPVKVGNFYLIEVGVLDGLIKNIGKDDVKQSDNP